MDDDGYEYRIYCEEDVLTGWEWYPHIVGVWSANHRGRGFIYAYIDQVALLRIIPADREVRDSMDGRVSEDTQHVRVYKEGDEVIIRLDHIWR